MNLEMCVQMCRMSISEAKRFPVAAQELYDLLFHEVQARLESYLSSTFELTRERSVLEAQSLLGQVLYPSLPRALCGLIPLVKSVHQDQVGADFDLTPIRALVTRWATTMQVLTT